MPKTRVDFDPKNFEVLINDQGYDLIHYKANMCACFKEKQPNPACDVCKGVGWVYNSSTEIKAIMTGIGKNVEFGRDGFGRIGTINITTLPNVHLAYRDKLTLLEGKVIYVENIDGEAKTIKKLRYPIVEIEEISATGILYVQNKDYKLVQDTDCIGTSGKIEWLIPEPEQYSVRYITYPSWIILNFPNIIRGAQTKVKRPAVEYTELPVKAIAKLEFRLTEEDLL